MNKFITKEKIWQGMQVPYQFPLDTFMGEEILKRLKETPDRIIQIHHETNEKVTCEKLRLSSVRIAQNLTNMGIKADDIVGVICKTSNEITFLLNACVFIGAPLNPLDLSFTKDEIKHLFGQTRPKLVICDVEAFSKTQKALQELDFEFKIIVTENEVIEGASNFSDLLAKTGIEDDFIPPKFSENAENKILAVMCSSGTTGLPKSVILTHAQMLTWTMVIPPNLPSTFSLIFSPIYWSSGFFPHILHSFMEKDVRIISQNGFNVQTLSEIVEKYQLTNLSVPPMHLNAILTSDFPTVCNHASLKSVNCMGSIVSDSLRKKFSEIFPDKNMTISYGSTEAPVSITLPGEFKENLSVGSALFPNLIAKVVDDDGNNLEIGEEGEICAKPMHEMKGYYNNAEASKTSVDDEGFFKTGDVGFFNEKGTLFVTDRKKEIWKYKGHHVAPSEIENVVEQIEGVKLVSAVGIPHEFYGSLTAVAIVKLPGYEKITEKYIIDYTAEKLSENKQIHGGVFFFDSLPSTPSGKVQKRAVLKLIRDKQSKK